MRRWLGRTLVASLLLLVARPNPVAADPPPPSSSVAPDARSAPLPAPDAAMPGMPTSEAAPPAAPPVIENPLPEKPVEAPPAPAAPTSQKGRPRLHIEADRPGVRLMKIERAMSDDMGEGILVRTVCAAPCDQVIEAKKRQTFFFGADGMVPSRGFQLSPLEGDITARIRGGSIVARQAGFLLGGFGGAAVLGGVTMLGVGYARNDTHLSNEGKIVEGPNPALTTGGFIVLGVGAAMVTTAIVLVATAKTKITLFQGSNTSAGLTFEQGALRF
jgi:hypothetical protein